jgi:hypothetical protein
MFLLQTRRLGRHKEGAGQVRAGMEGGIAGRTWAGC